MENSSFPSNIYKLLQKPFSYLEWLMHKVLLAPFHRFLVSLDPLARKLEGTKLRQILQVSIYPLFMGLTLPIGFWLVHNGYNTGTFLGSVIMLLCLGLLCAPLERLIPFSRRWLGNTDTPTDFMLFGTQKLWGDYINGPIKLASIALIVQQISPKIGHDIWPVGLHPYLQVILLLCINDFFRYWYHRWMHENEFMWRWHAVHHSSERLYWFNGTRSHPIEGLVSSIIWAIPFAFVKAPVEIVFVTNLLGRVIGRFQHTNMDLRLGLFDYIFSTPKNHRYHHSKIHNIGHTNYGGDVIIWDLLFGTFYLPKGQEPSDEIGIEELPNYPKDYLGIMLAPFTYSKIKKEANAILAQNNPQNSSHNT
jgi:ornithine lipid hydroxylase